MDDHVVFVLYSSNIVYYINWPSLVVHMVKNLPAVLETCVQSLGWEDPLGKGKAT